MKNFKKTEKPKEIAKKKKVSLDQILKQLSMGKKVEKEHTNNANIAKMIALQHLGELPDYYTRLKKIEMKDDLRNWFNPKHPDGGWKRINSKGEAIGPCARKPGEPKPKCMSNKKRSQLSKKERAAAVGAKRKHDSVADRKGKGGKPINVSNFGKGKISEAVENLFEKNKPTNPELWARAKAAAKSKFDVYPSAYANGWAAKWYKGKGGGWKTVKEAVQDIRFRGKHMRESTIKDMIKIIMEEKKSKKPYKGYKKGKNHPEGGLSRAEAKRQGIHAGIETKDEAKRKGGFGKLSKKTQGRRKSFCGRMCGMKRKNTSSKTARDPKSKINASLRVWGCRCEETCHECDKQLFGEEAVANAMGGGFDVQQAATQANPSLAGYDPPMGKPLSVSSFDKMTPTPNTKRSVKKALDMWRRRKIAESTLSSDQTNKKEERVKELKKHIGKFKLRYGDNAKSIIYAIATRDAKKIHEEIVNSSNAGTMTKGEIRKRDKTASKVKARPIKGDTEEESKHRIATFITLRSRGKKKKK